MVTKSLENLLKNDVARNGFKNNARWYYLGKNKHPEKKEAKISTETRLEKAINEGAKNVSDVYGISIERARIILLTGVNIYLDILLKRK